MEYKVPSSSSLVDQQFIQIEGPDGIITSYQYDRQTNSLWARESQVVIPSFHGQTHISSDPIPCATTNTPGLLCSEDKVKLDELVQMRLGVSGYVGSGFTDDNGFLQGDIILAAGSEFISIEKLGNTIRFTVDSPLPLACNQEACASIYWVQDETDTASIRPPSCAGKLPGVNAYGEFKIYLMPESTIVNPNNAAATLNKKGSYPAIIFKRYDNATTPGLASFDVILQRNSNGTSKVGWSMVPGANGTPQSIWFMGSDNDGGQIRFELDITKEPDLLGQILYKGHSITKQMGVIIDYTASVISNNQYTVKYWSVDKALAVGDAFTATNVWRYNNPTSSPLSLTDPQQIVLDGTIDVLPIGTLVSLWQFKIGEANGVRLTRSYFSKEPSFNPAHLWTWSNGIKFGDIYEKRLEINPSSGTDLTAASDGYSDVLLVEREQWGITGFDDPLLLSDDGTSTDLTASPSKIVRSDTAAAIDVGTLMIVPNQLEPAPNFIVTAQAAALGGAFSFQINGLVNRIFRWTSGALLGTENLILENSVSKIVVQGDATGAVVGDTFDIYVPNATNEPSGVAINNQYVATIDPSIPGLKVVESLPASDRERPVFIWDRVNHKNVYTKIAIGQPSTSRFPPVDILLRAPVDSFDGRYLKIIRRGIFTSGPYSGYYFVVGKGAEWRDLPRAGSLRILTGINRNFIWKYSAKLAFDKYDDDAVALIGSGGPFPFDDDHVPVIQGTGAAGQIFGSGTEAALTASVTVPSVTTVAEVLHQEFTCPAVRCEFSIDETPGQNNIQLQFRVGLLDMSNKYEFNMGSDPADEYVRGFLPGSFMVSKIYTQAGFITAGTETPAADPSDFKVYRGGSLPAPINGTTELFNDLEIMYRDSQIWIWWNRLLVNPDPVLSAALATPVVVNTPYFPVTSPTTMGKVALRLWPGAVVREVEVRDQSQKINEYMYGQLELTSGSSGSSGS